MNVLANVRKTYVTPPGQGFLPKDTAAHHRKHIVALIRQALTVANVNPKDIDVMCFTKGRIIYIKDISFDYLELFLDISLLYM